MRSERMRLVHQNHAAGALGHFHHALQGTNRTRRAVNRIHDDHTPPMPRDKPLQMLRIVVTKRMRRCASPSGAFPQRRVRERIEVHRGLGIGNGLQQAQVGAVARLADQAILFPNPARQ